MEKKTRLKENQPQIIDGKLVVPMIGGPTREINIEDLKNLLEWNFQEKCSDLILSFARIGSYLLKKPSEYDIQAMFPDSDSLYFLDLIRNTFSN